MHKEEIEDISRIARAFYRRWGNFPAYLEDDYVQYVLMQLFCEDRNTSLRNLLVDFLRAEFGDSRFKVGKRKSYSRHYYVALDDLSLVAEDCSPDRYLVDLPTFLNSCEYKIVMAIYDGSSIEEVAQTMGLTASRVSQLLSIIRYKVAKKWDLLDQIPYGGIVKTPKRPISKGKRKLKDLLNCDISGWYDLPTQEDLKEMKNTKPQDLMVLYQDPNGNTVLCFICGRRLTIPWGESKPRGPVMGCEHCKTKKEREGDDE